MKHRSIIVVLAPFMTPACYSVEDSGTTTTLSFHAGLILALGAVAAVALFVGIALARRRRSRSLGVGITLFGLFAGGIIVPAMWVDRVVITPTELRQKTGFWFAPTHKGFRYSDVESVSIRAVKSRRSTNRVWFLKLVGGGQGDIDPGDLWENNEGLVVDKLRGFGVRFY